MIDDIDRYAVDLVATGGRSCAEDDMDEDGHFEDRSEWRSAVVLALCLSRAIGNYPESFLAWYRSVLLAEAGQ